MSEKKNQLTESMYCKICLKYSECPESKTCSCGDFETNEDLRSHHTTNA